MDLTTWLAVLGFITGAVGLGWQILTHRLTGGRVRIFATREKLDDQWIVRVNVTNAGRLAASVEGVAIWAQVNGRRLRRLAWRAVLIARIGWVDARARLLIFSPCLTFSAPAGYADPRDRVQFPFVLQPGQTVTLPTLGITWSDVDKRPLRAAVLLGFGPPVQVEVRDVEELNPFVISAPSGNWTFHLSAFWSRPPVEDDESIIRRAMLHSALVESFPELLQDLERLSPAPATTSLVDLLREARHQRGSGLIADELLNTLRQRLDEMARTGPSSVEVVRAALSELERFEQRTSQ
ncbi:hypothetical protein [Streptomyces sp. NPDC002250]|uniref:hypothetical protein n=1 Tax=Streptomyces sp. NPDC002250 TaxID=3364641 RepID=UPI00368B58E7